VKHVSTKGPFVATLALGSLLRRGLARLRAKKEANGVTPHAPTLRI